MKSVLIVDDDESLSGFYESLIKDKYGDVLIHHALSGEEAEKKIHESDYTIVLIDIKIHEMQGLELYKKLKEDKPYLAQRTVVISGNPNDPHYSLIEQEGCPSLIKSFEREDFYHLVESILDLDEGESVSADSHHEMRKSARISSNKKCTIRPLASELSACKPTIADTIDYSESGMRFKYRGRYIPAGFEVSVTVFSLNISNKKGKVIWSRPFEGGFVSGLRWF